MLKITWLAVVLAHRRRCEDFVHKKAGVKACFFYALASGKTRLKSAYSDQHPDATEVFLFDRAGNQRLPTISRLGGNGNRAARRTTTRLDRLADIDIDRVSQHRLP